VYDNKVFNEKERYNEVVNINQQHIHVEEEEKQKQEKEYR
jgi:hypothetical protein